MKRKTKLRVVNGADPSITKLEKDSLPPLTHPEYLFTKSPADNAEVPAHIFFSKFQSFIYAFIRSIQTKTKCAGEILEQRFHGSAGET